ncbi:AfsR/SARP family transcriptional regulator [Streptomyces sp. S186]|uniref:AfsR/SARP family transcriptional regulator n=1 Tax=Streptomyces sp. S186 TaxID=3434395 RepID=UPI003F672425
MLDIRVLGPLQLRSGNALPTPTAPKERKLLALLLMNSGRTVPISTITEELWSDRPPRTAVTAIHAYVLSIRRNLAVALGLRGADVRADLLQTRNKGYAFHTEDCSFDLPRYQALESSGREALRAGDLDRGIRLLRQADGMWRGALLAGVDRGSPLRAATARVEQSRLTARTLRIEAEIGMGRHQCVLPELADLAVQFPFDELLHRYYMLALQRSGFRTEALSVFRRLRRAMAEKTGLEPSGELQLLYREIHGETHGEIDRETRERSVRCGFPVSSTTACKYPT